MRYLFVILSLSVFACGPTENQDEVEMTDIELVCFEYLDDIWKPHFGNGIELNGAANLLNSNLFLSNDYTECLDALTMLNHNCEDESDSEFEVFKLMSNKDFPEGIKSMEASNSVLSQTLDYVQKSLMEKSQSCSSSAIVTHLLFFANDNPESGFNACPNYPQECNLYVQIWVGCCE